jgi:hypothetical protein
MTKKKSIYSPYLYSTQTTSAHTEEALAQAEAKLAALEPKCRDWEDKCSRLHDKWREEENRRLMAEGKVLLVQKDHRSEKAALLTKIRQLEEVRGRWVGAEVGRQACHEEISGVPRVGRG